MAIFCMMHANVGGATARHSQAAFAGDWTPDPIRGPTMGDRMMLRFALKALPLAALCLAASFVSQAGMAAPEAAGANPFDALKGDWKGGGTVLPASGKPIKVACKVTYDVDGSGSATQKMRCSGDDYEIKATSKFKYKAGKITGTWTEAIYDANGGINGTAKDNLVHAKINGDRFSGRMSINASGDTHQINIVQADKNSSVYRSVANLSLSR